jgi:glutamate carboxypeptidase
LIWSDVFRCADPAWIEVGSVVPEQIFDHSVALLEELCAISSASGDAPGLRRTAERLSAELEGFDFVCDVHDELGADGSHQPVLVARRPETTVGYTMLVGHLDTVLPASAPSRLEERLQGTGALDMKGGFAALVGALALLADRGREIPDDLLLVGVPDEEVGGPISEAQMRSFGADARALLVLEPGARRAECETLVGGRRGLSVWRLEASGRAAHSGLAYWQGRSALAAAASWSGSVQQMSEGDGGSLVNVGRIVGGDSEFVQDLGEEHRFIGTSQRLNVVPDRCLAEGEIRYLSLEDRKRTLARMRELAAELAQAWDVTMDLHEVEHIPPVDPAGHGTAAAQRLVAAAADDGWTLEIEQDRGGVSFPNFLPDPCRLLVLDGLGPVGGGMHTREEYVDLRSLRRRIMLIAEALLVVRDIS